MRTQAEKRVRTLPMMRGLRRMAPLSGGVSNAAFVVETDQGKFVARVGADYPFHQVSRSREAEACRAAFATGLSPELVYGQDGVMVLRFIDARTYGEVDVQNDWSRCVEMVMRCHREMGKCIGGQGAIFWVFQILRDYAQTLRAQNHRSVADLPKWMAIVDGLEAAQVPMPIVFGHHDLLPTNFMNDGTRLWLIDWEYGAFGTALFDLANLAAANSFDAATEEQMLRQYFSKAPDLALLRAYHAMKVAAALREAMWGMVSELYLAAPGVDYIAYAETYIARFEKIHAQYLKDFS